MEHFEKLVTELGVCIIKHEREGTEESAMRRDAALKELLSYAKRRIEGN